MSALLGEEEPRQCSGGAPGRRDLYRQVDGRACPHPRYADPQQGAVSQVPSGDPARYQKRRRRTQERQESGSSAPVRRAKGGCVMPTQHEHGAGCWPGGESEFDCPIMRAFGDMQAAIRALIEWDITRNFQEAPAWKVARKALRDAQRAYKET